MTDKVSKGAAKKTNAPEAETSKHRLRLWLRILKVSRLVTNDVRNRLRDQHATTLPRFDVLSALYRSEKGLKMSELSSVLMVSNGNVTGIVDRLTDEGLIVRVPVEGDRRATMVRLTRKGSEQFAIQAMEHERWLDGLLSGLDADEVEQAQQLLQKIVSHIEKPETRE